MTITKESVAKAVETIVNNNVSDVDWEGNEISVNYLVDPAIIDTIATSVVDACFANEGEFNPYLKDFTLKCMVLTAYTNIPMPEDVPSKYAFIYGSEIFDVIREYICEEQLSAMFSTIDEMIAYRQRANVSVIQNRMMDVYSDIKSVSENLKDFSGNVSAEELEKFVKAIGESGLDEKKLVEAIVKSKK